jgi:hypothetical protein
VQRRYLNNDKDCGRRNVSVSEPLVLGGELADGQKLSVGSAFLAAGFARLLVSICVKVVVMHVLRGVLSVSGVGHCVEATVGNVQPAGL